MWKHTPAASKSLLSTLGMQHPIVLAPMAGVCTPALTAAVSNAGKFVITTSQQLLMHDLYCCEAALQLVLVLLMLVLKTATTSQLLH